MVLLNRLAQHPVLLEQKKDFNVHFVPFTHITQFVLYVTVCYRMNCMTLLACCTERAILSLFTFHLKMSTGVHNTSMLLN